MMDEKITGFTLIELVVTMTVIGILAAMAAPSFSNMIQSNRVITKANVLLTSLNLARSEAAKRGLQVIVKRQGSTSYVWESGWQVFVDRNQNGNFDDTTPSTVCAANEDCMIQEVGALSSGMTIRSGTNYDTWVGYLPDGTSIHSGSGGLANNKFIVCGSNQDVNHARQIVVNTVGRPRIDDGVSSCPS